LLIMIRDGNRFDLDGASNGKVIDPIAIIKAIGNTATLKAIFQGRSENITNKEERLEIIWTSNGVFIEGEIVSTDQNGETQITIPSQNADLTIWVKGERTIAISEYIGAITAGSKIDIGTLNVGDANGNNEVDLSDFFIFASNFGKKHQNEGFNRLADFNNDGEIDMADFYLFASNFGKTGAPRPERALSMPMASDVMSANEAYEEDSGGCNVLLLRTIVFLILAMFMLPLFRKR